MTDDSKPAGGHFPMVVGLNAAQLRSILLSVEEGIQLWDADGLLIYANPASADLFGNESLLRAGVHWSGWARWCSNENGLSCKDEEFPVAKALAGDASLSQKLYRITHPESGVRWIRFNAHILIDDDTGRIAGAVSSCTDVSALIEQERRMQFMAHYDSLTGLPNRVLLADRMDVALSRSKRTGEMLAICLLDLDGFKEINDSHGHQAGDLLLQEIARRLQDSLRGEDTAARLGGDEFALLIGGLRTSGQCEQLLKRILDSVAATCLIGGQKCRVSASIGVTLVPADSADAEQLLRHADQSMYKAKQGGKNRFSIFDPTLESKARANQGLLRKIEQALERGEFCLYYQPKVDCRLGRVVGLEALIRWQHPVLGLRMPGEFLPLIEHENVVIQLGEWVIAEALREQVRLSAAGHDLVISVNVSPRQFLRGSFEVRLGELLSTYPAAMAHRLEIEIVETAALEDISAVSNLVAEYHSRGVRFALDDFGTGYSSLVHLKRLAADVLKIDQTFVRDMLVDPGDLAIVQGVVGLAMAFQRQVVAEGVESIEQVLMLLELGCSTMQGYGIARPMPAERLYPWLDSFSPDPRWQVSHSGYPTHADFEMLLLEVAQRHWHESFKRALAKGEDRPALDGDSRLGHWCSDPETRRVHQGKPLFWDVVAALQVVRDASKVVQGMSDAGAQSDALMADFDAAHVHLIDALHAFRMSDGRH